MSNAQLAMGYESSNDFRDAFSRIMGAAPSQFDNLILKCQWMDTPLGPMLAIADDEALYLLEFVERRGLEREIERMCQRLKAAIVPGDNAILNSINQALNDYFTGKSLTFKTPIKVIGSPFQQTVWQALQTIPTGETRSYLDIAKQINRPTACRAVARANATNQLAIIIPCHRVVNQSGQLGGYAAGIERKQWLLDHERTYDPNCHSREGGNP